MRYKVSKEDKRAGYLQLYTEMRIDITEGYYRFGSRLPSKRMLAEETGTSVITVEHAYALLADEGYIESRERSGYYVIYREEDSFPVADGQRREDDIFLSAEEKNEQDKIAFRGDEEPEDKETGQQLFPYGEKSGKRVRKTRTKEHVSEQSHGNKSESVPAADGRAGSMPAEHFPFSVFARTMRRVLSTYGERILEQSENQGCMELRSAIAAYLRRSRGMTVDTGQILIGSGAEYLYGLAVQMLGRNRIYALEDPSYEKIRKVYEANGAACEFLKMGAHGIHSEELKRSRASVLHVTPFNSYPSGITASASKRNEYIRWAKEREAFIIEDDYDSEFTELTKAEDTLFSLEPDDTVIYINTFSRTISSSMRMGYMVLPANMAAELRGKVAFYACSVPVFEQYVLAEFIRNGDFERHINRVRRKRRQMRAESEAQTRRGMS